MCLAMQTSVIVYYIILLLLLLLLVISVLCYLAFNMSKMKLDSFLSVGTIGIQKKTIEG